MHNSCPCDSDAIILRNQLNPMHFDVNRGFSQRTHSQASQARAAVSKPDARIPKLATVKKEKKANCDHKEGKRLKCDLCQTQP